MVEEHRWSKLLNEIPIHAGDFFAINPGTVHAVKGALILETQAVVRRHVPRVRLRP